MEGAGELDREGESGILLQKEPTNTNTPEETVMLDKNVVVTKTVQMPEVAPSFALDWKSQIASQLRYRDMANGKNFIVISNQQSRLLSQERELKGKANTLELEVQKLKVLLQRQDGASAFEGGENPEVEAYKRMLADFKEHQAMLIKTMEEEMGRWTTKCQELEVESEKLRTDLKAREEEVQKLKNRNSPKVAPLKPVSVPRSPKLTLRTENEVTSVAFNSDGHYVGVGGRGKNVKIYDVASGELQCTLTDPSMRSVLYVGFSSKTPTTSRSSPRRVSSSNYEFLIATSSDGAARLWNMEDVEATFGRKNATVHVKHTLRGHSSVVSCAAFSGDSVKVVTGSYDRSIKVWDLAKGYCIRQMQTFSPCHSVCMANEENLIFSGHADGKLYIWDPKTGDPVHEFNVHSKRITSVAISPVTDRRNVMTISQDNTVKIFDLRKLASNENSKPLYVIGSAIPKGTTTEGSGTIVIGGSSGGGGAASGDRGTFKVGADWMKGCFSPDGVYAACGSATGIVFIWNLATCRTETMLHTSQLSGDVNCCAWYGDLLASGSAGGDVVLWNPETE